MIKRKLRRRLRTGVLGFVACIALFWGAVDIVGVPAANLWRLLGEVVVGVVMLIALAAIAGFAMGWLRRREKD